MAKVPVEIVRIGKSHSNAIAEAVALIDKIQTEFEFSILKPADEVKFQLLDFRQADADELLANIKKVRNELKGFHPYLIVVCNISLSNKDHNDLCGEAHSEDGLAIFTFKNIIDILVPANRIKAYISYYIARFTFNFLIPHHRSHEDLNECVFDTNVSKADLIKRMQTGSMCDTCRNTVMSNDYSISASQFSCLNVVFNKAVELLAEDCSIVEARSKRPKVFVGSSVEGLDVARKIQAELSNDFEIVIWNQGLFNKLGLSYLEILEGIVLSFEYGIFIFTPDDTVSYRGETKFIARDNVIFELGMFVGKLSRLKAFLVYPSNVPIQILSDFAGITKAGYDSTTSNLQAALGPVCEKIRESIGS